MSVKSVLIVDDEVDMLAGCVRALSALGFNILSADSGEKAIEILKSRHIDLLVTDLKMYGINGLDLLKYVKSNKLRCDVIIMTAYPSVDSAVESLRLGIYDYLRKPFGIGELREKIKKCLDAQKEDETNKEKINEVFTTYQISKLCGVTLTTVTNWADQGILSAYKTPGGHRRIKKEDLIEFFKGHNIPMPDEFK